MQEPTPKQYEPIDVLSWGADARILPEYIAAVDDREQQMNGMTLYAGKMITRRVTSVVAGVGTAGLVGLALLGGCNSLKVHGEANLKEAQAVSKTQIIEALKEHPIQAGTIYSLQDYAATNLAYKLTVTASIFGNKLSQDLTYKTNTKVLGKTATQLLVTDGMIQSVSQNASSGKAEIILNPSELVVNSYWVNAPSVNHFKLKDGKQEICENDCMEPQTILNSDVAEWATHIGGNTLKNTFYVMDKKTNRKLEDIALLTTQTNCKGPMSSWAEEAVVEGVQGVWSGLTGKPKDGVEVKFSKGELKWNTKKVPEAVEKVNDDVYAHKDVQITGAPELTKTECNTSGVQ